MPVHMYVVFAAVLILASLITQNVVISVYVGIGYIMAIWFIGRKSRRADWKFDELYTMECFARTIFLWPVSIVVSIILFIKERRE